MPELNRSTLMDQIDYDLDNYKINESSICTNSIDISKHSIPKQQFLRAKTSREFVEDVRPKFMGFLNENQQQNMFKSDRVRKELTVIPKSKGISTMLMQQFSFKHNTDSSGKSKRSSAYNSHAKTSSNKKANR